MAPTGEAVESNGETGAEEGRRSVAIVSMHGDPLEEIGHEGAGGQNVHVKDIAEALSRLGWMVDVYTRSTSAVPTDYIMNGFNKRTQSHDISIAGKGQQRVDVFTSSDPDLDDGTSQPARNSESEMSEVPIGDEVIHLSRSLRVIRVKAGDSRFLSREELVGLVPEFAARIAQFSTAAGYDVIHSNYWLSGKAVQLLRQSHGMDFAWVHTNHSLAVTKYGEACWQSVSVTTMLTAERDILQEADCVIATSDSERELLTTLHVDTNRTSGVPCGVDVQTFKPSPSDAIDIRESFDKQRIVLYVGRLDPRKGVRDLLRALPCVLDRHPDTALLIVGGQKSDSDWQELEALKRCARELSVDDKVHFLGEIEHGKLIGYYSAANVCVIPSIYEPFGLVSIEAMACGAPVVASNVGGLSCSVVNHKTGLLVEPGNSDLLAKAIIKTLDNPELARLFGKNGRTRAVKHFSLTSVGLKLDELYSKMTKSEDKKSDSTYMYV